ncbi:MAG: hypothetical protein ACKOYC_05720, partial [Bacteroidota bacterium]
MNRLRTFLRYAQVGFEGVVFLSVLSAMVVLAPGRASAACETAFTLDWSNPATYSVSCGNVTPS